MSKIATTALFLTCVLGACKTSGVDQSERAAGAMRRLHTALQAAPEKITAVSTTLATLYEEGGDMKAEFAAFSKSVDAAVSHRDRVRSLRAEVESNRKTLAGEWEKRLQTIQDDDLRERSTERREALVEEFTEAEELAQDCRDAFEPWMQKALDVRTYLESDLNPTGVASVKDAVREVTKGAEPVNKKIAKLVSKLDELAERIAAAKPPPETK